MIFEERYDLIHTDIHRLGSKLNLIDQHDNDKVLQQIGKGNTTYVSREEEKMRFLRSELNKEYEHYYWQVQRWLQSGRSNLMVLVNHE